MTTPSIGRTLSLWLAFLASCGGAHAETPLALHSCHLAGVAQAAQCGKLIRPFDARSPAAGSFDLHIAVLPALALQKKPDPIVFVAGGPGQSAIELAGPISQMLNRLNQRRDIILVDQRGTGLSAPLQCPEDRLPRSDPSLLAPEDQARAALSCLHALERSPHGRHLDHFSTEDAVGDLKAVTAALNVEPVNLVAASYGTRVALSFLANYPHAVRRTVLDGVVPPGAGVVDAAATDAQTALQSIFDNCAKAPECQRQFPDLATKWRAILDGLPKEVRIRDPRTGRQEPLYMTRAILTSLVHAPLYNAVLSSALPLAISRAADDGDFEALMGLGSQGLGSGPSLYSGMHFAVACVDDRARLADTRLDSAAARTDFGSDSLELYRRVCASWPQPAKPVAPRPTPPTSTPVLMLSGQLDPITPARHLAALEHDLGPLAKSLQLPNLGHGTLSNGCARAGVFSFVDTDAPAQALRAAEVDIASCSRSIPRPPPYGARPPASAEGAQP